VTTYDNLLAIDNHYFQQEVNHMNKLFLSLAIVLFSSLLLLNLAGCGGNSSNENANTKKDELTASTPEEYTQSVLALLAANEPERFIEFAFPTKEELLAFIAAHVPEDQKEQAREQVDREYNERKAKVLASFDEIRQAVETAGGDWKSVKTNYDLRDDNGITGTSIYVVISAGNKTIEMELDDCLLMNGRWYGIDEMELRGPGENAEDSDTSSGENTSAEEGPVVVPGAKLTASTPEEFAQSVIALLAANDPNKFIEFAFPAREELLAVVLKAVPADKSDAVREDIEEEYLDKRQEVLRSFTELRNEQASEGCDWKAAKFAGAEYRIEKRGGISQADIDVRILAGGDEYEFRLDDCMLLNGRWYTLDEMR